jgi:hypothetical protein
MTSENPLVRLNSMLARLRWQAGKDENHGAQKVCWLMESTREGTTEGIALQKNFFCQPFFPCASASIGYSVTFSQVEAPGTHEAIPGNLSKRHYA